MSMFVNLPVYTPEGKQATFTVDINLATVETIKSFKLDGAIFYRLCMPTSKATISQGDYLNQVLPILYPKEYADDTV